jgi:hypothetical protein
LPFGSFIFRHFFFHIRTFNVLQHFRFAVSLLQNICQLCVSLPINNKTSLLLSYHFMQLRSGHVGVRNVGRKKKTSREKILLLCECDVFMCKKFKLAFYYCLNKLHTVCCCFTYTCHG